MQVVKSQLENSISSFNGWRVFDGPHPSPRKEDVGFTTYGDGRLWWAFIETVCFVLVILKDCKSIDTRILNVKYNLLLHSLDGSFEVYDKGRDQVLVNVDGVVSYTRVIWWYKVPENERFKHNSMILSKITPFSERTFRKFYLFHFPNYKITFLNSYIISLHTCDLQKCIQTTSPKFRPKPKGLSLFHLSTWQFESLLLFLFVPH